MVWVSNRCQKTIHVSITNQNGRSEIEAYTILPQSKEDECYGKNHWNRSGQETVTLHREGGKGQLLNVGPSDFVRGDTPRRGYASFSDQVTLYGGRCVTVMTANTIPLCLGLEANNLIRDKEIKERPSNVSYINDFFPLTRVSERKMVWVSNRCGKDIYVSITNQNGGSAEAYTILPQSKENECYGKNHWYRAGQETLTLLREGGKEQLLNHVGPSDFIRVYSDVVIGDKPRRGYGSCVMTLQHHCIFDGLRSTTDVAFTSILVVNCRRVSTSLATKTLPDERLLIPSL
ncbi:hypothetical protein EV363DRAFT_1433196 [Boletus edulis]|nr:hypothetical protein EV363DRAFT_1433196 [Boletus edulis]